MRSLDIDLTAMDLEVLELFQGHFRLRSPAESKHCPTDVTVWAVRTRWPQEDGRVGLGESGPDCRLDLGRRSAEWKAFGDEKDTILSVALDLVLPLRVVSRHSV